MSRAQRTNLILLAALASLLGLVALTREQPEPPPAALTALSVGRIGSLRLEFPAGAAIELHRRDDGWWLTAPVETPANEFELQSLLAVAEAPALQSYAAAEVDLAAAGLQPPGWRLVLDQHTALDFGRTEPLQHRRYVRHGDTVHLIDDISVSSFDVDYADLVSRQLLAGLGEPTEIRVPGLRVWEQDGQWFADPPPAQDAAARIERFVSAWRQARATWVIRPLAAEYTETRGGISLRTDRGTLELKLLKSAPQLELIRPGLDLNYSLPGTAAAELLRLPELVAAPD